MRKLLGITVYDKEGRAIGKITRISADKLTESPKEVVILIGNSAKCVKPSDIVIQNNRLTLVKNTAEWQAASTQSKPKQEARNRRDSIEELVKELEHMINELSKLTDLLLKADIALLEGRISETSYRKIRVDLESKKYNIIREVEPIVNTIKVKVRQSPTSRDEFQAALLEKAMRLLDTYYLEACRVSSLDSTYSGFES